ncbi:MAG: sigma-54 dependent transcriptional regulator [Acidobacteriota bacterium]
MFCYRSIGGESGTGKEVVARAIHALSKSPPDRFVPFNCAAVPKDLVESQLFGYRKGSYTGAVESFMGILRSTSGGTLFLDEVADLSPEMQPKLLRFLDRGEVLPLGEVTPHHVSLRVIAAANANLEELVRAGRFRADLYYRLSIIHLHIPPLRERWDDILPLARHFLDGFCARYRKTAVSLSTDVQRALLDYHWPGNVRELANVINGLVVFAKPGSVVTMDMLPAHVTHAEPRRQPPSTQMGGYLTVALDRPLQETLDRVEQAAIERALLHSRGRATETAKRLGLSRKGLYLKRRRLGWANGRA